MLKVTGKNPKKKKKKELYTIFYLLHNLLPLIQSLTSFYTRRFLLHLQSISVCRLRVLFWIS